MITKLIKFSNTAASLYINYGDNNHLNNKMSEEDIQETNSSNFEDQFKQFLAENKIDTSALAGTKDEDKMLREAEDQRTKSILKAVSRERQIAFLVLGDKRESNLCRYRDATAIRSTVWISTVRRVTSSAS